MLGVDWSELLLVGVVALIVVGPKDLPMLMGRLGKAISAIRRMGNEFQREINKATGLDAVTDLRKTFTDPLKKASAEITREFNKITPTGVQPSGVIKPAVPGAQSVVDEIHAATGMTPPLMTGPNTMLESPAPIEAIAPVADAPAKRVRTPRPKPVLSPDIPTTAKPPIRSARAKAAVAAAATTAPVAAEIPAPPEAAPPKPRKPRTPKAKPEVGA